MPLRRRVSFLLGGAMSSSILRGDSKTECLFEEVVDDGLDDDDPFFLVQRLVVFFYGYNTLSHTNKYLGFSTCNKVHKYYFSLDFEWIKDVICCTKQAGWMAKSKVVPDYKLEHTNKELDGRLTSLLLLARFFSSALMLALLLRDRVHLPNVLVRSFACIFAPST
jgi:hypothetical protein